MKQILLLTAFAISALANPNLYHGECGACIANGYEYCGSTETCFEILTSASLSQ
jgi:hypothetical protein